MEARTVAKHQGGPRRRERRGEEQGSGRNRREALLLGAGASAVLRSSAADALGEQGRMPGLPEEDSDGDGWLVYTRPAKKEGNHGVGWSEPPQYSFKLPADSQFSEIPTNVFDPSGSEIDAKFRSPREGDIAIVVAPIKRFMEIPEGKQVSIEDIGDQRKVLSGFHAELFGGEPLDDGNIEDMWSYTDNDGLTYYRYNLEPRRRVTATAVGNRMLIMAIGASAVQWRKSKDDLEQVANSFFVPQGGA